MPVSGVNPESEALELRAFPPFAGLARKAKIARASLALQG
jgi:hypothetical protein